MQAVKRVGPVATVLVALFVVATYLWTDSFSRLGDNPGLIPIAAVGVMLAAGLLVARRAMGWAFVMTSLAIAFTTITIFMSLYPRVMVSSLDPAWSLTIYNASSSPYTLTVMSVVALLFVPVVLAYKAWTYWVFRKRVGGGTRLEY